MPVAGHRRRYALVVAGSFSVELVGPAEVRPLRHAVLRPGWPPEASVYPGDDHPDATHVALRAAGGAAGSAVAVVAVGTLLPEAPPWEPGLRPAWRIRGMACALDRRGTGLGRRILDTLVAQAARRGGGLVWCHARAGARGFYERAGFSSRGEVFELPGIGPHLSMTRVVRAGDEGGLGQRQGPVPT